MPIIIRVILQRVLAGILSVLAFFGISPEVNVVTSEEAQVIQEQRNEDIKNYFDTVEKETNTTPNIVDLSQEKKPQNNINTNNPPTATKTPEKIVEAPKTPEVIPAPVSIPEIITETKNIITDNLNSNFNEAENSVVNILCVHRSGSKIEAHAGSGVLIDSKGVVVTNAHVAQFFLLESNVNPNFMNCALYKENIPTYGYKAKLLYISPDWVRDNYTLIRSSNPKGTGKGDFAFLYITGNTNPAIRNPSSFPNANFSKNYNYKVGNKVFAVGYPGAPSSATELTKSVKLKSEATYISEVYTLGDDTIDIFSTGATIVAQKGASGGGIFSNNNLIGLTVTVNEDEEGKKINALTTEYINRDLSRQEEFDVDALLTPDGFENDLMYKVNNFYETEVPDMRNLLLRVF